MSSLGASAQVLHNATRFRFIGSRQTIPASDSFEFDASPPQGPEDPAGPRESSPATAAIRTPVRRGSPISHHASDEGETSPDTSIPDRTPRRRRARRGNRSRYSSSDSDDSHASAVRRKKKDGF